MKTIVEGNQEITLDKYHAPTAAAMKSYNETSMEANKVMGTYVSVPDKCCQRNSLQTLRCAPQLRAFHLC